MHIEDYTHLREIYEPPVLFNCIQRNLYVIREPETAFKKTWRQCLYVYKQYSLIWCILCSTEHLLHKNMYQNEKCLAIDKERWWDALRICTLHLEEEYQVT